MKRPVFLLIIFCAFCRISVAESVFVEVFGMRSSEGVTLHAKTREIQDLKPVFVYQAWDTGTSRMTRIGEARRLVAESDGNYSWSALVQSTSLHPATTRISFRAGLLENGVPGEDIIEESPTTHIFLTSEDYRTLETENEKLSNQVRELHSANKGLKAQLEGISTALNECPIDRVLPSWVQHIDTRPSDTQIRLHVRTDKHGIVLVEMFDQNTIPVGITERISDKFGVPNALGTFDHYFTTSRLSPDSRFLARARVSLFDGSPLRLAEGDPRSVSIPNIETLELKELPRIVADVLDVDDHSARVRVRVEDERDVFIGLECIDTKDEKVVWSEDEVELDPFGLPIPDHRRLKRVNTDHSYNCRSLLEGRTYRVLAWAMDRYGNKVHSVAREFSTLETKEFAFDTDQPIIIQIQPETIKMIWNSTVLADSANGTLLLEGKSITNEKPIEPKARKIEYSFPVSFIKPAANGKGKDQEAEPPRFVLGMKKKVGLETVEKTLKFQIEMLFPTKKEELEKIQNPELKKALTKLVELGKRPDKGKKISWKEILYCGLGAFLPAIL